MLEELLKVADGSKFLFSVIRQEADHQQELFSTKLGCSIDDPRLKFFTALHNTAILGIEYITFHQKIYSGELNVPVNKCYDGPIDKELYINDFKQKIYGVEELMFIKAMSVAEYSIKRIVESDPKSQLFGIHETLKKKKRGRIYLRDILMKSNDLKFFKNIDDYTAWINMVDIRNIIVHNFSHSDITRDCKLGGISIKLDAGKPIDVVDHDSYGSVTIVLINLFSEWLRAFQQKPILSQDPQC